MHLVCGIHSDSLDPVSLLSPVSLGELATAKWILNSPPIRGHWCLFISYARQSALSGGDVLFLRQGMRE